MTLEKDTLRGVLNENITRGLIRTALQEDMSFGPDVTSLSTVSAAAQATRPPGGPARGRYRG